ATYNYFGHDLHDGTSFSQNMINFGYTNFGGTSGENIAAGYSTASSVFSAWKSSVGHNANMLMANYTAIGIGRAYGAKSTYGWYWTTDFGGYVAGSAVVCGGGSAPAPTNTPAPVPTPTPQPTATVAPSASVYVAAMTGKASTKRGTTTI